MGVITVSENYNLTFNSDGSVDIVEDGGTVVEGTWTRDGDAITVEYNAGAAEIRLEGTLVYDQAEASIEGHWFRNGAGTDEETFTVDFVIE